MIDLSKLSGVFDFTKTPKVTIIGVGSVGSSLAELVARLGVPKIVIYDADKVELKNMPNSMLYSVDEGRAKTDCIEELIHKINPECSVVKKGFWNEMQMQPNGVVFLAVDSIDIRRKFCEVNLGNENITAVFDIRTGLYTAQGYAADWSNMDSKKKLLKSMQFDHSEVTETRSACGAVLGLAPVVRIMTAAQIMNLVFFNQGKPLKEWLNFDAENFELTAF